MDNESFFKEFFDENEKPLDRICDDGGYCAIFRRIACIGDSLSSGEFETRIKGEEATHYNDFYEHSWGQYMARMCGSEVFNFSKGGMTAKQYCESFGNDRNLWDPAKWAHAYLIALGCNDYNKKYPIGTIDDVHPDDWHLNGETFYGYLGQIISRYKEITPDAKFFLVTMVYSGSEENKIRVDSQREVMYALAEKFDNAYVLDIAKYGLVYNDDFKKKFYLRGHLNPCGYILTAKVIASYIDWIIRHNMDDFKRVGYINTDLSDSKVAKKEAELALADENKTE